MRFDQLVNKNSLTQTVDMLREKGYEVFVAKNGIEALERIKEIIPNNSTVMNGSSVTLEQIGYIDYLKSGNHKWVNLHAKIAAEPDRDKRIKLRRESMLSDYYLGSVHAVTETGEYLVASNTGSQIPHIAYTSLNLIFVVSTKKIVSTLEEALERIKNHVFPLEDKHMMKLYGQHSKLNKIIISSGESMMIGRKVMFILVEENLGF